ncbi:hypothetical protein [Cystobacter ferrugineus]|uniref:Uncharacterized protein n=1 Tax=Cystobacter ferrugineus TaxID=83449 RepID=A0A1L9B6H2_9BACT|nr:hypothetical protein [Cystobacter ferrugineus]OJH37846.1 hypothetical protein BON30_27120 [Cystobacter ferrugineus]
MDFFLELIEGVRSAGRKGGVVAVLFGAVILAGGLSFAREAMDERHHYYGRDVEAELAAMGIILGAGSILGGLSLIITGGSSRSEPTHHEAPNDPLDSVPLPYSLCVQCPQVVKRWNVQTCSRCGGDLVDIQNEEDEQWARETLAALSRPAARRPTRKVPRVTGNRR